MQAVLGVYNARYCCVGKTVFWLLQAAREDVENLLIILLGQIKDLLNQYSRDF